MRDSATAKYAGIAALVVAGMLTMYGSQANNAIESKISSQSSINQRLSHYLNAYQTLEQRAEGWDSGYRSMDEAKDLLGIYQALSLERFNLVSDLDTFRLTDANPYIVSMQAIGMVEVCMDSGGGELAVRAKDYQSLLSGLSQMAQSQDVSFSSVTIQGEREQASALLGDVCMLLRDETIG